MTLSSWELWEQMFSKPHTMAVSASEWTGRLRQLSRLRQLQNNLGHSYLAIYCMGPPTF